jgi:hypothetical protein
MMENEYYDITLRNVKETMENSKNRKASGLDSITNKMLKHGKLNIQRKIAIFFEKIINTRIISQEWKISITIPIFKKG